MVQELVGGTLYKVVLGTICRSGIIETLSGDVYISHYELKRALGERAHIPREKQMTVIKELTELGFISIKKPIGVYVNKTTSCIFYVVNKKVIDEE